MSNIADDFDYEDDDQPQESNPLRARMKQLEKENREYRKALAEADAARREASFLKAGIDPAEARFKYFVKGYDGELSPDAIRLAAEEAQLITPQPTPADTDKQAWQTSNKIAAGAETVMAESSWMKRINDANSEEELMAVFAEAHAQGINLSTD